MVKQIHIGFMAINGFIWNEMKIKKFKILNLIMNSRNNVMHNNKSIYISVYIY